MSLSHENLIQFSSMVAVLGVLLLALGAVGGALLASRVTQKVGLRGFRVFGYHRRVALAGAGLLLLHPILLVPTRETTGVGLVAVFVPFLAEEKVTVVAYGTLALDLLLVVALSSLLVGRWVGRKVWRLIHFATYPVFGLGLFHGLAISRGFGPGATVDPSDPRKVLLGLVAAVVILSAFFRVAVAVGKRYRDARMR